MSKANYAVLGLLLCFFLCPHGIVAESLTDEQKDHFIKKIQEVANVEKVGNIDSALFDIGFNLRSIPVGGVGIVSDNLFIVKGPTKSVLAPAAQIRDDAHIGKEVIRTWQIETQIKE